MRLITHARAMLAAFLMVVVGLVVVASPASAHQGNITAQAQCLPDGTYQVTYTLSWSQVPEAAYGTRILTRTDTDGQFDSGWENNPGGYSWTDRGSIDSTEGQIQWTDTLPGDSVGAGQWEYGWTDWSNGTESGQFHDTRVEDLGGDCAKTEPETVTVNPSFTDNVCVGGSYTEPGLQAPEVEGTTVEVDGTVAPGETVTVTYTALEGYVIEGQSVFEHTFPSEPASVEDCADRPEQPEPVVDQRSEVREDCVRVERRTWDVVTGFVWDGEEWVAGEPEIRNDTGWVTVRRLSSAERIAKGCLEVEGEEEETPETPATPTTATTPAGDQTSGSPAVPTAVDAGI